MNYTDKPLRGFTIWYFLLLVLSILAASGCRSKKPVVTQDRTITISKSDSLYIRELLITKTQALSDSLNIKIPTIRTSRPDCDSICQEELNRVLSLLNVERASGQSKQGISYDQYRQILTLYQHMQATQDRDRLEQSRSTSDKADTQIKTVKIPELYTPWWMKLLAGIGAATVLWIVYWITWKIRSRIL